MRTLLAAVTLLALAAVGGAAATEPANPPKPASRQAMRDVRVPAGAVRAFLDACRRGEYERAAARLDLEGLGDDGTPADGARIAWQLKVVLDRAVPVQYELLSTLPGGDPDDGLPADVDRVGRVDDVEILLERVETDGGERVWKFASGTVAQVPSLYGRYGFGALGELLPAPLFESSVLDLQLWQWLGLLIVALGALVASWIGVFLLRLVLGPIVRRTATPVDDRLLGASLGPLRWLATIVLFRVGVVPLALPADASSFAGHACVAAAVVGITWLVLRALDLGLELTREHLEATEQRSAMAALPLGGRVLKVFVLAIGLVALLQNVGFNVSGILAGLGVGGLAVALAAQKSIANLFGGASLLADRPIRVGDFCSFGSGRTGTVEEIGLRSTRVRTLDRTLVTIPNAEFSEMQLENFGARDRIRFHTMLNLRYETTPEQMRYLLTALRRMLVEHPKIADEPRRVRFVALGAHSLDVEIHSYIQTSDWNENLAVREHLLLQIMDAVRDSGTGFAFPSQTLYLGRDGGIDRERTEAAEREVAGWREAGELPFPDEDPETVAKLEDRGDWPPRGSVARRREPDPDC